MSKVIAILLFTLVATGALHAQRPEIPDQLREARFDSLLNEILFEDDNLAYLLGVKKNYQFLYYRTAFDTRTFYAGREIGSQQYNFSGQLYYMHSKGIYAGVSGAWYSQLNPGYRTTVLTLGYSKGLKKKTFFRYRISYDYFVFNNDDPDFEPLYTSGMNAGITLKSKTLGTRMNYYMLLGKETGSSFSWDAYSHINLLRLGTYDRIRLEPQALFYFGSEAVEHKLSEVLVDPMTNISYDSYYKDEFGLMNIQLQLPLRIKYKSFDFDASWIYNFPQTKNDAFSYQQNSSFRFSIGYIFNL
ncbi:MAG TPA: hypothetical protein VKA27_05625 [Sunxiuqinia sp.]|nr:hypothetical protein [Sunxiuqinia sp.]